MAKAQIITIAIIFVSALIVASIGLFIRSEKKKIEKKIKFWK
jgi:hypothetical protein